MAKARIEYLLESKRIAAFETNFDLSPFVKLAAVGFASVLIVQVRDDEDADELIAAIEKVGRTPTKRKKRTASAPGPAAKSETPSGNGGDRAGEESKKPNESRQSPGQQVAGEEAGAPAEGAETPRSTAAGATDEEAGPAGAPGTEQGRGAGAGRPAGSETGSGGPPTAPAAAKMLCRGTTCHEDGDRVIHNANDPTCTLLHGRKGPKRVSA